MSTQTEIAKVAETDLSKAKASAQRARKDVEEASKRWLAAREAWRQASVAELAAAQKSLAALKVESDALTGASAAAAAKAKAVPDNKAARKEADSLAQSAKDADAAVVKAEQRVANAKADVHESSHVYESVGMHYDATQKPAERWCVITIESDGVVHKTTTGLKKHSPDIARADMTLLSARRFMGMKPE